MLRHHARADPAVRASVPVHLIYSVRAWDDVLYREELERLAVTDFAHVVKGTYVVRGASGVKIEENGRFPA